MYYQQTPISEKPDEAGWYMLFETPEDATWVTQYYFEKGSWYNGVGDGRAEMEFEGRFTHWLRPITGVVMTEEEFERLYDGIVQNIETSVKRSDMPTWEQVLEMIKRDQIH